MEIVLLILAVLPTIVLGYYIYTNDKIEKEPTSLLFQLGLFGIVSVVLTLVLSLVLGIIIPFFAVSDPTFLDPISLAIYVFIGIALVEEFSKWICIYKVAWKHKEFNHVYDAIVYSVFVSLGFATIENLLYVFGMEDFTMALSVAFQRMIFSVPGHAFFGVLMGYYLGLAKLTYVNNITDKSKKYLYCSLLVPTFCHFIFDYLLMCGTETTVLLFYAFVIILFTTAIKKVKRLSNIPTKLFNDPTKTNYVYNAFGNTNNIKYCSNCGQSLSGPYCGNCGYKNY